MKEFAVISPWSNSEVSPSEYAKILKTINDASRIVSTWPEWKQNILEKSGSPTVSTPRKPIANDDVY